MQSAVGDQSKSSLPRRSYFVIVVLATIRLILMIVTIQDFYQIFTIMPIPTKL
jgi:hypothetical protein